MLKLFDSVALFSYCGFIYYLSSQSSIPTPMLFLHQDKIHHLAAYFIMGILSWRLCRHLKTESHTRFMISLGFCSIYALTDEWHQSFVPGRDADVFDWIADTLGALLSITLFNWREKIIKQTSRH